MTGAAVSFRLGTLTIHQTLAVRPDRFGRADVPLTRGDLYGEGGPDVGEPTTQGRTAAPSRGSGLT